MSRMMDIKIKDGECWGTVYVVLFKIDGIDTVRVFTEIEKAITFCSNRDGFKTMFTETLDRGENE